MKSVTVGAVIVSQAVLQKFGMFVPLAHHRLGHAIRARHAGLSIFSPGTIHHPVNPCHRGWGMWNGSGVWRLGVMARAVSPVRKFHPRAETQDPRPQTPAAKLAA